MASGFYGYADWTATCGLRAKELDLLFFHKSKVDQFFEGFIDFGDQRSAGHRDNDIVRQAPAQLLGDFVTHGLRAFGVIRPQVHVDEAPAMLVRDLRAETVDVVVIAVNTHDLRAVDLRAQ